MRKIYLFLVGLCWFLPTNAQLPVIPVSIDKYTVIDTINYFVTYELTIVNNPEESKKPAKDIVVLEVGNKILKSYSKLLYQADSINSILTKKGTRAVPLFQELVPPVIVYKNYPKGENTVVYRTFMSGPIMEYVENIPTFEWKVFTEKQTILGYTCQKATTSFRGRVYEAWFTPEIPIKEGPYKFAGLPGLILQIADAQNHYSYTCIGIQKPKRKTPIVFWEWDTQKTNREKLNSMIKRMHQQPADFAVSIGTKLRYPGKSEAEVKKISYPYNPIELE
ncbi:GLPGLI family protein [uncultured Bacteroides sp.]|uniref:GLPGLI family protein n=1 Tax=uncultured Bacteroides sp. TaxID=162156 RepID=UPI0027DE71FD|nr:GLPGLI family protein [uncultured Bacteroides sp.]